MPMCANINHCQTITAQRAQLVTWLDCGRVWQREFGTGDMFATKICRRPAERICSIKLRSLRGSLNGTKTTALFLIVAGKLDYKTHNHEETTPTSSQTNNYNCLCCPFRRNSFHCQLKILKMQSRAIQQAVFTNTVFIKSSNVFF